MCKNKGNVRMRRQLGLTFYGEPIYSIIFKTYTDNKLTSVYIFDDNNCKNIGDLLLDDHVIDTSGRIGKSDRYIEWSSELTIWSTHIYSNMITMYPQWSDLELLLRMYIDYENS